MAISNKYKSKLRIGLFAVAATTLLSLAACAIKETTDPATDGDIVVSVSDSSKVNIIISSVEPQTFVDSGEFSLDEIRKKMSEKGISKDAVKITGLSVTYDDETKAFLTANKGVKFILQLYTRAEELGSPELLTLETADNIGSNTALAFDPDLVLFELNKQLFGNAEGFPGVLSAIKDESKHKINFIAKVKILEALKTTGVIKLNLVVSVTGKV
jgi:hypothetical protein